jgi:thiosulfate/3-mercaptopyruvate sulfurtransferase
MNKNKIWINMIVGLSILFLFAACSADVSNQSDEYANPELLVDTGWLEEHLRDDNVRVVDMRDEGYEGGHIEGAVRFGSWKSLVDADNEIDGYLLNKEKFEKAIGALGIDNNTTVIIYDEGKNLSSARLFYALEYYGHKQVKLLNGGFMAWLEDGKDISTENVAVEAKTFTATIDEELMSTKEEVGDLVGSDDVVFLDARSEKEYSGEDVRAEKGGHIPGAVNLDWALNVEAEGVPYFKKASDLRKMYGDLQVTEEKTVVPYCQTNVRGAHAYFTLRLLGFDHISPYEGSWAEWGNDPSTTVTN